MKILVIADDFTGAAEIAGIGWRFGLPTRLLRGVPADPRSGLAVVDSDTRLLPENHAAAQVAPFFERAKNFDFVYKKIDSILRGPVRAEIHTAMLATRARRAVLVPQNPSRNRVIRDGVYYVGGKPLHQTEFATDPHHPARTSNVHERIGLDFHDESIDILDAETPEQVERIARTLNIDELPVGGADLFAAILLHRIGPPPRSPGFTLKRGGKLFVCGTTSVQREAILKEATNRKFALCPITDNTSADEDFLQATASLENNGNALLYFDGRLEPDHDRAAQIQTRLANATKVILSRGHATCLLIEGGATAAAVCTRIKRVGFDVAGEIAQGIVALRKSLDESGNHRKSPLIIVKPGSYVWPCEVFD